MQFFWEKRCDAIAIPVKIFTSFQVYRLLYLDSVNKKNNSYGFYRAFMVLLVYLLIVLN